MATSFNVVERVNPRGPGAERNARTVSFLAVEDADKYPAVPLMCVLCLVALSEGADASLFPASTFAILKSEADSGFTFMSLSILSMAQSLFQAFGGPMWGIIASNAYMPRKNILILCTIAQGAATVIMCIWVNLWIMTPLRAVNGIMLAGLRPIANSIVGDRFNDSERGRYFGMILSSMSLGSACFGLFATAISEEIFLGWIIGWKVSFITVGVFTMALGPLVWLVLKVPDVKQDGHEGGVKAEFDTLRKLFKMWTFAGLVLQGCFGLIPWRAFEYRTFFFQIKGLPNAQAGTINSIGMFVGAAGNFLGGVIGDLSTKFSPMHGRILTAEVSVFGGIPIAYLTFMVTPEGNLDAQFWYYVMLVIALGVIATWPGSGTNPPLLCSIASERERSLVIAWQTSLEGAIGALGPVLFTFFLSTIFKYDQECLKEENLPLPECQDASAAGNALFFTSCVPWVFCGLIYSSLHCSYPKDLDKTALAREQSHQDRLAATLF